MSHSTPARSKDVEYVTNWPAVLGFMATLVIFVGVAVVLVNTRPRLSAGIQADATQAVLAETQLVAGSRTFAQSSGPPTGRDLAVAGQPSADLVENSQSIIAAASLPSRPPVTRPAFSNDAQPHSLARMLSRETAAFHAPPATTEDRDDWLPKYEFQFLTSLKENSIELDLDSMPGTSLDMLSAPAANEGDGPETATDSIPAAQIRQRLLAQRSDLAGLPFRAESRCRMNPADAQVMAHISTLINRALARTSDPTRSSSPSAVLLAREASFETVHKSPAWGHPDSVATAVQMLQVETLPLRLELIAALSRIDAPSASAALADRAMFDAAEEVRSAAIEALRSRPANEYRHRLLAGLRYPWATAAFFAAQALVALDDKGAVRQLVDLLDEADPTAPYLNNDGKLVKNELVRVNHLRNCVLCHAPSLSDTDPIRGAVPTPGQPIPQAYYDSHKGSFVRADVVYLKQDFSAMHEVENAAPWPSLQRFDYLVRVRELTPEELADEQEYNAANPIGNAGAEALSYPQRKAVILALRALTHQDAGDRSESWRIKLANWSETK